MANTESNKLLPLFNVLNKDDYPAVTHLITDPNLRIKRRLVVLSFFGNLVERVDRVDNLKYEDILESIENIFQETNKERISKGIGKVLVKEQFVKDVSSSLSKVLEYYLQLHMLLKKSRLDFGKNKRYDLLIEEGTHRRLSKKLLGNYIKKGTEILNAEKKRESIDISEGKKSLPLFRNNEVEYFDYLFNLELILREAREADINQLKDNIENPEDISTFFLDQAYLLRKLRIWCKQYDSLYLRLLGEDGEKAERSRLNITSKAFFTYLQSIEDKRDLIRVLENTCSMLKDFQSDSDRINQEILEYFRTDKFCTSVASNQLVEILGYLINDYVRKFHLSKDVVIRKKWLLELHWLYTKIIALTIDKKGAPNPGFTNQEAFFMRIYKSYPNICLRLADIIVKEIALTNFEDRGKLQDQKTTFTENARDFITSFEQILPSKFLEYAKAYWSGRIAFMETEYTLAIKEFMKVSKLDRYYFIDANIYIAKCAYLIFSEQGEERDWKKQKTNEENLDFARYKIEASLKRLQRFSKTYNFKTDKYRNFYQWLSKILNLQEVCRGKIAGFENDQAKKEKIISRIEELYDKLDEESSENYDKQWLLTQCQAFKTKYLAKIESSE